MLAVFAALVFAVVSATVAWRANSDSYWDWTPFRVFGVCVILLGGVLWGHFRQVRIGRLVVLWGAAMFVPDLRAVQVYWLRIPIDCVAYLHLSIAGQLALSLPDGRLRGRFDRALVVASYVSSIASQIALTAAWDRPPPPAAGSDPPPFWAGLGSVTAIVLSLVYVGLLTYRLVTISGSQRRVLGVPWVAAIMWTLMSIAIALASVARLPDSVKVFLTIALLSVWTVTTLSIVGVHRAMVRLTEWRLAALALRLERGIGSDLPSDPSGADPSGADPAATHLRKLTETLVTALGDPTLRLVHPPDQEIVATPEQATTPVYSGGRAVAFLVHDRSLLLNRALLEMTTAVVAAALERRQLAVTAREQITQLQQTRDRLHTAALDERRRIQRDLHDGAQHQLFATGILLDVAKHQLEQSLDVTAPAGEAIGLAKSQLADAIRSLRELTVGIYPQPLTEDGLRAALTALCDGSPIPVTLDVAAGRWPREVEFAAYFLVAEALANVYHHSRATRAGVRVRAAGDRLDIEVTDDGRGLPEQTPPTALRGLRERVASVGGQVGVSSNPGTGTTVRATVPMGVPV